MRLPRDDIDLSDFTTVPPPASGDAYSAPTIVRQTPQDVIALARLRNATVTEDQLPMLADEDVPVLQARTQVMPEALVREAHRLRALSAPQPVPALPHEDPPASSRLVVILVVVSVSTLTSIGLWFWLNQ